VVDDGSTDGTAAVVEEVGRKAAADGDAGAEGARGADGDAGAERAANAPVVRLLRNGVNRGKGYSIKHGALLSTGTFLLLSDADFSTPIEWLPKLLEPVAAGACAIAIGSRGLPDSQIPVRQPRWREMMGRTFNRLVRALTGLPFADTQCGFKVMRREAVMPLFRAARIERFAYDVEILYLARKAGLPVQEIAVLWRNALGSKVHPVRDAWVMFKDIVRIRRRDRRGGYGRIGDAAGAGERT
jgi:glycosyltransferase involved in cell wall biosynthesis